MKTAASERKSSKTLKGQLFGAISMMLVAAIALGTSTYAWFVNNQTVEVEKMNLTVSTATSLQIAVHQKGGATVTPYKNLIANGDINGAGDTQGKWTNMFADGAEYRLAPASADNTTAVADTFYVSNGHMNTAGDKLDQFVAATVGEGQVKKLPLSFLTSTDLNVYFGKAALTSIADLITAHDGAADVNAITAADQAAAIRTALRVAIVPKAATDTTDKSTYTAATEALIFQFNDGTANQVTKTQIVNTGYSAHTPTAVYNETEGKYIAVTGTITVDGDTKNTVNATGQQLAQVPGATAKDGANLYLVKVENAAGTGVTTVTNYADNKALFDLKANKARDVDVYIWLEGADGDCLSALSNFTFDLALPFAGAPTSATARP